MKCETLQMPKHEFVVLFSCHRAAANNKDPSNDQLTLSTLNILTIKLSQDSKLKIFLIILEFAMKYKKLIGRIFEKIFFSKVFLNFEIFLQNFHGIKWAFQRFVWLTKQIL